jgi:hypothetical protein
MKVRVWISGPDGVSHDFELLDAPRIGERVSISVDDHVEDGVVADVTWQLQAFASGSGSLEPEPPGSVTLVHVICDPRRETLNAAAAEVALEGPAG